MLVTLCIDILTKDKFLKTFSRMFEFYLLKKRKDCDTFDFKKINFNFIFNLSFCSLSLKNFITYQYVLSLSSILN